MSFNNPRSEQPENIDSPQVSAYVPSRFAAVPDGYIDNTHAQISRAVSTTAPFADYGIVDNNADLADK